MVERFTQIGDELLAVLSNGDLLATPVEVLSWDKILPEVKGIAAVTGIDA